MEISPACLPPRQPVIREQDRSHPRFREYLSYRSSMTNQLAEASSFSDWLYQNEQEAIRANAADHPQYPAFLAWMRQTKAGARRCPKGDFPQNFKFWLSGGRW